MASLRTRVQVYRVLKDGSRWLVDMEGRRRAFACQAKALFWARDQAKRCAPARLVVFDPKGDLIYDRIYGAGRDDTR